MFINFYIYIKQANVVEIFVSLIVSSLSRWLEPFKIKCQPNKALFTIFVQHDNLYDKNLKIFILQ